MSITTLSSLDKQKMTYTATGMFVVGAILFVIGSLLLFTVSKSDLDDAVSHSSNIFDL
ncbi:hypothetical protein J2T56_000080 [Natronobacillus azotifigens]|uniref:Uncharacterized protein n=1 Tax=Natronobacillus azotifigens TaxID=472978 RepID=A0A9J6R7V8_9BACI|nr:hypothetical protein [Natronobacillus azotifigens]MCZ0701709.1 hypothetical protein [Natronobacillus azotifigens]